MFYHKSSWMLEMEFEFEGKPRTPAFAVALVRGDQAELLSSILKEYIKAQLQLHTCMTLCVNPANQARVWTDRLQSANLIATFLDPPAEALLTQLREVGQDCTTQFFTHRV